MSVTKEELRVLFNTFQQADIECTKCAEAAMVTKGTPEAMEADLSYKMALVTYAKAKIKYDDAAQYFINQQ